MNCGTPLRRAMALNMRGARADARPRKQKAVHAMIRTLLGLFARPAAEYHSLYDTVVEAARAKDWYLGGVTNNKIGRLALANADPDWMGPQSYWGRG